MKIKYTRRLGVLTLTRSSYDLEPSILVARNKSGKVSDNPEKEF